MAENIIVYTPNQGTNREKYFTNYIIKVKMPTLVGKKTTFPSISSLIGRAISISRQKIDGPNPSEMDIKVLFLRRHIVYSIENCIIHRWKVLKIKYLKYKNKIPKA